MEEENKTSKEMEKDLIDKTKQSIKECIEDGITPDNLDDLGKLVDIYKDVKEVENMNYGNYGNYNGYGNYGNYDNYNGRRPGYDTYGRDEYGRSGYGEYGRGNYGARGRDMRYRGDDYMDRMSEEYGRYMESRQRYGAGSEEEDKSFHYMVKALEDFVMVLKEEAESPKQKQELMTALQNSMR